MRIAWVTPFNSRSAIGRVSADVTELLGNRGHHVTIIRSELQQSEGAEILSVHPVLEWRHALSIPLDQQFDAIIVNLGDNYAFHAGALPIMEAFSCLAIFHDVYLYNFFRGWVVDKTMDKVRHHQEIKLTYGNRMPLNPEHAWLNRITISEMAIHLPMTEWFARRCGAALAHSDFYVDRLKSACAGPVAVARLPFGGRNVAILPLRARNNVVLSTVGIINPNKCVDRVIEAIGSSALLRQKIEYRLVGAISDGERARLAAVADQFGFSQLTFVGEVDDNALCAELERADIISCLRRPVLEGASASAIEGMKSGRPVMVADAGFYAELPDNLVFKVPADLPIPFIARVLERLLGDEQLRMRVGEQARGWAEHEFTVRRYVEILEGLLEDFIRVTPLTRLSRRIGVELSTLGVAEDDPAVARIAARLQDLFLDDERTTTSDPKRVKQS